MDKFLSKIGYDKYMNYNDRILYFMLLASILVSGFYLVLYLLYIPLVIAIVVHIVYISFSISLYYFLKIKRFRFVKFSMILAHMTQLTLAVFVWFSVDTGYNIYYFMVPLVTFLTMKYNDKTERNFTIITSLVAAFLYFFSEVVKLDFYMYQTSMEMNRFITGSSILCILLPMIYILLVFSKSLYASHRDLEFLANTDALTKIANRRVMFEQGIQEFELARKYKCDFSLIIFDLDNFKLINDQYGHPVGDIVLQKLSELIMRNTRDEDTFARYGGEEFAILLCKTNCKKAAAMAEKLLHLVRETSFVIEESTINITISIGVAKFSDKYKDFDNMLKAADQALYEAKNDGRNRVVIADKNNCNK